MQNENTDNGLGYDGFCNEIMEKIPECDIKICGVLSLVLTDLRKMLFRTLKAGKRFFNYKGLARKCRGTHYSFSAPNRAEFFCIISRILTIFESDDR